MTNRERISEMKVVDFFAKYHYDGINTFDSLVVLAMACVKCPMNICHGQCSQYIRKWLDEEELPEQEEKNND